ncbi:hypothetical protein [Phaeocystidibacter luteus]|uniref:Uncharacterized protein n=1 Tax=Phaeocystidibacter luteus TaxID=911197 RepID=A0A6N6RKY1_9FLAO|nr:hypothetical protein [Phaeocystidibacter luteus]KAB2810018.1 hypothetical protein F8C67_09055 [Phaeocystidibacter luteus]
MQSEPLSQLLPPSLPTPEDGNFPRIYEEDWLPGLSYFRHLTRGEDAKYNMSDFGYVKGSRPNFNAFARRLRVACSIEVSFSKMGQDTANGYAALTKHFLMFSAFERYANEVVGVAERRYEAALPKADPEEFKYIHRFMKEIDEGDALWNWLMDQKANHYQGQSLLSFRNGFDPMKAVYVSAMLRNSFAHGVLTAHPAGTAPGCVEQLATRLTERLYRGMLQDFWARMRE